MAPGKKDGRREQRPHRPHALGPRIFTRGRWQAADLRPWGGGRVTLRNPAARGWPDRGSRTEDEETARRWAWAYVDHYRDEQKREHLGLRKRSRPIVEARREWINHRERQKKATKTIEGGATATGHLQDYVGKAFPIEDVPGRLQEFFDGFLDAGYAPSTLDTMRRHLSVFLKWAGVPMPDIELPTTGIQPARAWTDAELARIRKAADPRGLRLAVELAITTGARQAELWALERQDFNEARRTVFIRRQLDREGTRREQLKGRRARTAVVLPGAWDFLPDAPGVLLQEEGRIVKLRRSRDLLLEVLEDAGLDETGVGWHRFRHTYARLFLLAGGWMDELQRSLGHKSLRTTEQYYGHFAPNKAAGFAVSRIYGQGRHLRAI